MDPLVTEPFIADIALRDMSEKSLAELCCFLCFSLSLIVVHCDDETEIVFSQIYLRH